MKKTILLITLLSLHLGLFAQSGVFLNVSNIRQGQALPVTITGTNTQFMSGSNTAVFYKSGSPTTDLSLKNIVVGSNVLMGGIIEANVNAPSGTSYTCTIKNLGYPDVPLSPISLMQSGNGTGSGSFLVSMTTDTIEAGMPTYTLLKGVNTHFTTMGQFDTMAIILHGGNTPIPLNGNQFISLSNTSMRIFMAIPPNTANGWYDLKINNSTDGTLILPNAIYVMGYRPGYRLYAAAPVEANRNETLTIGITGVRTKFTQGSHTLGFFLQGSPTNQIHINSMAPVMDTVMAVNISVDPNAIPGDYGIVIGNTKYVQYLQESFRVKGVVTPKQVSITPSSGLQGQTLQVYFSGTNVSFASGSNTVQFFYQGSPTSMVSLSSKTVISPTLLSGNLTIQPNAPTGNYNYIVSNTFDPLIQSMNTFQVIPATGTPTIVSISPSAGGQGQALQVSITGLYTHFGQGSATNNIKFMRQGSPTSDIVISGSAITNTNLGGALLISPTAQTGYYDLQISNMYDGTMTMNNAFSVYANSGPHLASITPNQSFLNKTLDVSITGVQTHFTQGSQTLYFFKQGTPTSEIYNNSHTVINDQLLNANITISPFAEEGLYNIALKKNDDTTGYSTVFLLNAFVIGFPIGINEQLIDPAENIILFPNPAHGNFTICSQQNELLNFEIFDMLGRKLMNTGEMVLANKIQVQLDDFVLPNQQVFVRIYTRNGVVTKKLLLN